MIGKTVTLNNCPAYVYTHDEFAEAHRATVSGTFTVEEYHPYEPSAYVWGPTYSLVDAQGWIDVDADVLIEQVDPERAAREREQEAQWERDGMVEWCRELWPCPMEVST